MLAVTLCPFVAADGSTWRQATIPVVHHGTDPLRRQAGVPPPLVSFHSETKGVRRPQTHPAGLGVSLCVYMFLGGCRHCGDEATPQTTYRRGLHHTGGSSEGILSTQEKNSQERRKVSGETAVPTWSEKL